MNIIFDDFEEDASKKLTAAVKKELCKASINKLEHNYMIKQSTKLFRAVKSQTIAELLMRGRRGRKITFDRAKKLAVEIIDNSEHAEIFIIFADASTLLFDSKTFSILART